MFLVLSIYYQVRHFQFVNFDDHAYVTSNSYVLQGFTKESLNWVLLGDVASNWHPLTMLTHMLDVDFYGMNAGAHHLTNVQIHAVNTLLMFLVCVKLFGGLWKSAFIAAVFAVHPLHVESVAWVSERKDVLSACFWLLTMLSYSAYIKSSSRLSYWLMLVSFKLGLLAKPMLVTLPFVLLLIDYWPLERFSKNTKQRIEAIYEKLPLLLITVVFSFITYFIQKLTGSVSSLEAMPWFVRAANIAVSYVIYIKQTFLPVDLSAFYPYPAQFSFIAYAGSALLVFGVSFLVWHYRKSCPYAFVGWCWFLGTLVPVIGIVQVGMQAHADRYMYLPMTGILILVTFGAEKLFHRFSVNKIFITAMMCSVVMNLSYICYRQVSRWKDSGTLFEQAIQNTTDNSLAYFSLATHYYALRQYTKARENYYQAMKYSPNDPMIYLYLYGVYRDEGNDQQAQEYYGKLSRMHISGGPFQGKIGLVELENGNYEKASQLCHGAVAYNKADATSYNCLGVSLSRLNRNHEGLFYLRHAESLQPGNPRIQSNLGISYKNMDRLEDAIAHFGNALAIDPGNAQYLVQFRGVLQERKKLRQRALELEDRLQENPGDAKGFYELAMIYRILQHREKELQNLETAVRKNSELQNALVQLGIAYAERSRFVDAVNVFKKLATMNPDQPQWIYRIATVQARMKDADAACKSLGKAIEMGYPNDDKIKSDLNFDPIRENECFQSIVAR